MNREELLADKKNTRAVLAGLVEGRYKANLENMAEFKVAAEKLSEAISDQRNDPYFVSDRTKRYDFDEAITRTCALLAERPSRMQHVSDLESEIDSRKSEAECLREEISMLTAERDTAQEAAAAVGAAFNDFRKQSDRIDLHSSDDARYLLRDGEGRVLHRF